VLSTELFTPRATVDPTDTRHAICGADAQWHGAFPKCIECDADAIAAGRCGALCTFGIDGEPPIANAGWGVCEYGLPGKHLRS
jgi:hypothetical protein